VKLNLQDKKAVVEECYRPKIQDDCPQLWKKLITQCWIQFPHERPKFTIIKDYLNKKKNLLISKPMKNEEIFSSKNERIDSGYVEEYTINHENQCNGTTDPEQ